MEKLCFLRAVTLPEGTEPMGKQELPYFGQNESSQAQEPRFPDAGHGGAGGGGRLQGQCAGQGARVGKGRLRTDRGAIGMWLGPTAGQPRGAGLPVSEGHRARLAWAHYGLMNSLFGRAAEDRGPRCSASLGQNGKSKGSLRKAHLCRDGSRAGQGHRNPHLP